MFFTQGSLRRAERPMHRMKALRQTAVSARLPEGFILHIQKAHPLHFLLWDAQKMSLNRLTWKGGLLADGWAVKLHGEWRVP
mmetsp:Transcript_1070/g.2390  ORF Transcript_1070/g.2390 Transcript_1070/m.2390 type:complete len:82 (-) Transcript_1070:296-541(-)